MNLNNKIFRRRISCLYLFLIFSLSVSGLSSQSVDAIRKALNNPNYDKVLVVAHRGNWRSNAPENSLAAIEESIKMKIDIVELDVWKTKDGHLVLMHDDTVDRTTNGKGRISDLTLAEIKSLYLKDKEGKLTEHRVPTLEEGLLKAKGKIMVNLDKAYGIFDEAYKIIEKTDTSDMIIMKGGANASDVKRDLGKYLDNIVYMPVISLDDSDSERKIIDFMSEINPVAFELCYSNKDSKMPLKAMELLRGHSLIWYNTLWDSLAGGHTDDKAVEEPEANYGYLIDVLHARIIQTDRPNTLLKYLREKGLHE